MSVDLSDVSIRVNADAYQRLFDSSQKSGVPMRLLAFMQVREFLKGRKPKVLPVDPNYKADVKILAGLDEETAKQFRLYASTNGLRLVDVWRYVLSSDPSVKCVKQAVRAHNERAPEARIMRSYKLPVSLSNKMDERAEKDGVTRTDILVKAVSEYLGESNG